MEVKKMKRKIVFALGIVSTLMITALLGLAHTEADPFVTDLIAGQHTDVGNVSVWNDDSLHVKYETIDGWEITEIHLHVAESLGDIPQTKKNNPIPGKFDYSMEFDPPVTEHAIDLGGWDAGVKLYIAAHAVVEGPGEGCSAWDKYIGLTGTYQVWFPGSNSYFDAEFNGEEYEGWCADVDRRVTFDPTMATLYSIFDPAAPVDKPENLTLVNYILNTDYITDYSSYGGGWREIQAAIWKLIDNADVTPPTWAISWDETIAAAIVADALANGEDFDPCEGDWMAFVVFIDEDTQMTLIRIPRPRGSETAWGDGLDFDGNNWAMYFEYTVQ